MAEGCRQVGKSNSFLSRLLALHTQTHTGEAENLLVTMAEGCRQAGKSNSKPGATLNARKLGKVCVVVYVNGRYLLIKQASANPNQGPH